eukprot:TRINITY_DN23483_c0_g1_i1.p1 TRINITY_DN23483_c0_g1~~TRINITY_DN23483_c0_g1_i1.p1  ORF type:complete len:624 (-),score=117.62 TRINITY_DN23483_c0_g1_i1:78-1898(-)
MQSVHFVEVDDVVEGLGIHELLATQLAATERLLACNQAIKRCLDASGTWTHGGFHYLERSKNLHRGTSSQGCSGGGWFNCISAPSNTPADTSAKSGIGYIDHYPAHSSRFTDRGDSAKTMAEAIAEVSVVDIDAALSNRPDLSEPLLDPRSNASDKLFGKRNPSGGAKQEPNGNTPGTTPTSQGKVSKSRSTTLIGRGDISEIIQEGFIEAAQPESSEDSLYHTDGYFQAIARNSTFQQAILMVIVLNTMWMGVDTDYNKADVLCDAPLVFQIADNFFCLVFTVEIFVRIMALKRKRDVCGSMMFDLFLALMMIWETWVQVILYEMFSKSNDYGFSPRILSVLRIFRVLRLLRLFRFSRVLLAFPELFILVKGMAAAMRSMLVTLSMLLLIVYVYAIIFTDLFSGTKLGEDHFDHVLQACNFMLLQVLCGFDATFVTNLLTEGFVYYILWLSFQLFAALIIMNMLIAILCEVVSGTAEAEKEILALVEVEEEIRKLDADQSGSIDKDEWRETIQSPSVMQKLMDVGVDIKGFVDFAQYVFQDCDEMSITDFVHLVVQFRGSKTATVKDIVNLRKLVTIESTGLEALLQEISDCVHGHERAGQGAAV